MGFMLGGLVTLLDDVKDGAVLIASRVVAESLVTLSCKIHIA